MKSDDAKFRFLLYSIIFCVYSIPTLQAQSHFEAKPSEYGLMSVNRIATVIGEFFQTPNEQTFDRMLPALVAMGEMELKNPQTIAELQPVQSLFETSARDLRDRQISSEAMAEAFREVHESGKPPNDQQSSRMADALRLGVLSSRWSVFLNGDDSRHFKHSYGRFYGKLDPVSQAELGIQVRKLNDTMPSALRRGMGFALIRRAKLTAERLKSESLSGIADVQASPTAGSRETRETTPVTAALSAVDSELTALEIQEILADIEGAMPFGLKFNAEDQTINMIFPSRRQLDEAIRKQNIPAYLDLTALRFAINKGQPPSNFGALRRFARREGGPETYRIKTSAAPLSGGGWSWGGI